MGSITIRNINEEIKKGARLAAAANGRSVEAELRALLEKTYAPAIDERTAKIRAMSSKEFIQHLIKTANGADIEQYIPPRESEDFEFPEL
jgi:antitoxin FitA